MEKHVVLGKKDNPFLFLPLIFFAVYLSSCQDQESVDKRIEQMDSAKTVQLARSIEALVKPELAEGLTLRLWGVDSLVISPIAIHMNNEGKLFYTTTNRQKNSEFDIRG